MLEFDSQMSACFDNNGTLCVDHGVLDSTKKFSQGEYGNASNRHVAGARPRMRLNELHGAVRYCAGRTMQQVQKIPAAFASVADRLRRLGAVAVQE